MKIGSLCTGYGGLDMAVECLFDAETIWYSEFDKQVAKIFEYHYPQIPNLWDLTKINWLEIEPIDILTAGYPCQPFSQAGQRKGTNDPRHIWPHIAEAISTLRPKLVILENVRGHLTLGFDEVLGTLTEIGYDARWQIVRASDIGAPHQRARLFIIAYPKGSRWWTQSDRYRPGKSASRDGMGTFDQSDFSSTSDPVRERLQGKSWSGRLHREYNVESDSDSDRDAHSKSRRADSGIQKSSIEIIDGTNREIDWGRFTDGVRRWERLTRQAPNPVKDGRLEPRFVEWMMGLPMGWITDTPLSRSQQLKALGNGVVPQQAAYALKILLDEL